ncbi:MAG: HAD-IB family phosphatase [Methanobrevibacter sp.]|jgi:HAD superfamily phosphoserine phosphatase-like hydrolase|nr:HAD-IB family phosphatase [Candidatus Methanoflexus mossambicus]
MSNRAFCFDLSGTITKEEIIPMLGKELGIYEEIQMLTEATSNGEIPPLNSFSLRFNLIKELDLNKSQKIISKIDLNSKILDFIKLNSQNCFIITSALDIWLEELKNKIPCKFFSSTAKLKGGKINSIDNILNKAESINQIKKNFDEIIAIGGDMGDVEMFQVADRSIAFLKIHKPVQSLVEESDFVTFSEEGLCNILNTLS